DTLVTTRQDALVADTIYVKKISSEAIEKQVTYKAEGYKRNDLIKKTSTLVKNAEVNYDNIRITADSIEFNMETSQVFATGIRDTAGVITGKPVLVIGSEIYNADTLVYNFKTGKALVKVIATQQQDGLLRSRIAKMFDDQTTNIYRSTYSTCEADTPHFYINLPKAKVYPGKKIISGPGNLVLEGIPLPLFLPFGYFPIQTKRAASGILMPKPHYEDGRGYALTDGGYYFALNNYFDLTLKGNIFTNGSWLSTVSSTYSKRYKFSGSFSFTYANNITGHKGLPDYRKQANYSLGWNFSQNPKARPGSTFSASVNMSSSGFDRNNSYNLNDHITTQRHSSISYSKTWAGTPFNFSASMNHSQNIRGKHPTVNLNLPKMNFNMSRIYPLKSKRQAGPVKWYQELSFSYSAKADNQISTYDSLLFTNKVWDNMKSGFSHQIPVSFQLRPFRNFSITPSLSYSGVLYTQKINKTWDINYRDPETNQIRPVIVKDTARGYFYGHSINPSIGAGYSPQIFGLFQFTNPDSRVRAVRHVMKPSVSFSYIPFLKGLSTDLYRQVQSDTTGRVEEYSIFEGGLFGTPSLARKSGNVSFNLTNILEAKVFERNDTSGKPKNVKLIDNFGISTSYNVFADSLNWSPVNMVMRTTLFQNISISAGGNFSFYALDNKGRQTGRFYYTDTKKPLRLTSLGMSLDFSLSELLKGDESKRRSGSISSPGSRMTATDSQDPGRDLAGAAGRSLESVSPFDEYGYMEFDIPWSMNVAYNINYSKLFNSSQLTQTLRLNGNLSLTKKMNVTFNSGFDFTRKEITMTQIAVTRDLHCWDMSFSWIPNGYVKMWEFSIRVKAAVLSDLKYERRKDYHDNF
ncbi:MAG: LPS-assembly protein LptD, partial [Bacteroidales bacterium]|nr:LPS-assembly protein LptD [Bacteroidales bacterium]